MDLTDKYYYYFYILTTPVQRRSIIHWNDLLKKNNENVDLAEQLITVYLIKLIIKV